MLKREDFTRERIDNIISEARKYEHFEAFTHKERDKNRKQFLNTLEPGKDLWVFGYGSLIWNPAFHFVEKRRARLFGFHRSFCLHLSIGRGSPEKPGLMLALDRGGSCHGVCFRIAAKDVQSETEILWLREMISGAYKTHWGNINTDNKTVKGLTFIVNRDHSRYIGRLSMEKTTSRILQGEGILGTCRNYLFNTVQCLEDLNIHDGYLDHLCKIIKEKEAANKN